MLAAMVQAAPQAGVEVVTSWRWERKAPVLMSYGLGHPVRREWTEQHKAEGGRLIGWDMGYWLRNERAFSMRLTIDEDHPHRRIREAPENRWESSGIRLRNDANPNGPIVLVGLGRKSCALYGWSPLAWEAKKLRELRARFPGKEIVFRPKKAGERLPGCVSRLGTIEDAIRGASLVVCHHSNVAVDACIAGVPVECEDGAALALYRHNANPTTEERLSFLRSLAWWQWTPLEAATAWEFIKGQLCD